MGGGVGIGVIEKILYTHQNLKVSTVTITTRKVVGKRGMGRVTCLIVIAGFHPSSSFRMERQTVPEGYTFG